MSPRSVYLRDQAEKCRAHAASMTDDETRQQLRVLAGCTSPRKQHLNDLDASNLARGQDRGRRKAEAEEEAFGDDEV
jgi:hypothetical protein